MLFLARLTTILAFAAPLALAAPAAVGDTSDVTEIARRTVQELDSIIQAATDLGVDVKGPIPTDYDSYDPVEGKYDFSADSKANAWARAQIALAEHPDVEKRQTWANIGIGMWAQDWCNGQGSWFDNVRYSVHHYATTNYFSAGLSYRGLRSNEQLDFSRKNSGSDWCGTFVVYKRNIGTGCFNTNLINCFNLWIS